MYNLLLDNKDSNNYYENIAKISDEVSSKINSKFYRYLDDFMQYVKEKNLEKIRSREEYGIEILMIGVLWREYIHNANAFKYYPSSIFLFFNKLRIKEKYKENIDSLRGILNSKILTRKAIGEHKFTFKNFKLLIKWLNSTGDFNEEVIRLKQWEKFFGDKDSIYLEKFLEDLLDYIDEFYEVTNKHLENYICNLNEYLLSYKESHNNREDIIYCGKGKIQYYFNMVSAEIMNKVYRSKYKDSKEKLVFLPACMRQTIKECRSEKTNRGYKCIGCSDVCNVNKVRKIGIKNKFTVFIIPHETELLKLKVKENDNIGIIGIACITNLLSGGWKAIRLGFIPQCILLDYCGCNHWYEKSRMTSINYSLLKNI